MCVCVFRHVRLFVTPWTATHQAPLSTGFPRQEYWSQLPFPSSKGLPDPEFEFVSLASPALAGRFFTTVPPVKPMYLLTHINSSIYIYIYMSSPISQDSLSSLVTLRFWDSPGGTSGKESACQCRRPGFNPWVRKIPWRRTWQPTPLFWPGKSHGQRSLVGYSPWGCKELDTAEAT